METDRPFREWPIEQLAEQALLHANDRLILAGLVAEAGCRPGTRAKALQARITGMIEAIAPVAPGASATHLRGLLAAAAREIALLRERLAAAELVATAQRLQGGDPVDARQPHRRVYLTPNAPAWLVTEVRRAFRRRYHPDSQGDETRRRRAEEVFKRAETVFAEIERHG